MPGADVLQQQQQHTRQQQRERDPPNAALPAALPAASKSPLPLSTPLDRALAKHDLAAELLLPTPTNISAAFLRRKSLLAYIAVQQWVQENLHIKLPLLQGTFVVVPSASLTHPVPAAATAGAHSSSDRQAAAATAAAIPWRLRQVSAVELGPLAGSDPAAATVVLVGGDRVAAGAVLESQLREVQDHEYLCCELADMQLQGRMRQLRVFDVAHMTWRCRVALGLGKAMKTSKQDGADAAAPLPAGMLQSLRSMLCQLPPLDFIDRRVKHLQLSSEQHGQQLQASASRWVQFVQRKVHVPGTAAAAIAAAQAALAALTSAGAAGATAPIGAATVDDAGTKPAAAGAAAAAAGRSGRTAEQQQQGGQHAHSRSARAGSAPGVAQGRHRNRSPVQRRQQQQQQQPHKANGAVPAGAPGSSDKQSAGTQQKRKRSPDEQQQGGAGASLPAKSARGPSGARVPTAPGSSNHQHRADGADGGAAGNAAGGRNSSSATPCAAGRIIQLVPTDTPAAAGRRPRRTLIPAPPPAPAPAAAAAASQASPQQQQQEEDARAVSRILQRLGPVNPDSDMDVDEAGGTAAAADVVMEQAAAAAAAGHRLITFKSYDDFMTAVMAVPQRQLFEPSIDQEDVTAGASHTFVTAFDAAVEAAAAAGRFADEWRQPHAARHVSLSPSPGQQSPSYVGAYSMSPPAHSPSYVGRYSVSSPAYSPSYVGRYSLSSPAYSPSYPGGYSASPPPGQQSPSSRPNVLNRLQGAATARVGVAAAAATAGGGGGAAAAAAAAGGGGRHVPDSRSRQPAQQAASEQDIDDLVQSWLRGLAVLLRDRGARVIQLRELHQVHPLPTSVLCHFGSWESFIASTSGIELNNSNKVHLSPGTQERLLGEAAGDGVAPAAADSAQAQQPAGQQQGDDIKGIERAWLQQLAVLLAPAPGPGGPDRSITCAELRKRLPVPEPLAQRYGTAFRFLNCLPHLSWTDNKHRAICLRAGAHANLLRAAEEASAAAAAAVGGAAGGGRLLQELADANGAGCAGSVPGHNNGRQHGAAAHGGGADTMAAAQQQSAEAEGRAWLYGLAELLQPVPPPGQPARVMTLTELRDMHPVPASCALESGGVCKYLRSLPEIEFTSYSTLFLRPGAHHKLLHEAAAAAHEQYAAAGYGHSQHRGHNHAAAAAAAGGGVAYPYWNETRW